MIKRYFLSLITCTCFYLLAASFTSKNGNYEVLKVTAPFPMQPIKVFIYPDKDFIITDFGAVNGGRVDNTKAITSAIEACNQSGGGRVVVPAGTWLTGPIHFKSNVNLYLEENAVLNFTDNPSDYENSLNYYVANLAGVEHIYCTKTEVAETIQKLIVEMKENAVSFRYCYGGGKSLEGVYAYYDAVRELKSQYQGRIDEVYVACGTGTTLTGICCGMQEFFPTAKVHGISVARCYVDEKKVLDEDITYLNNYLNRQYDFSNLIFHDEFLFGGYGHSSNEELVTIKECISRQGMLIDPTYSGKAFHGMCKILSDLKQSEKTVLFWNTGGMMNLFSQKAEFRL